MIHIFLASVQSSTTTPAEAHQRFRQRLPAAQGPSFPTKKRSFRPRLPAAQAPFVATKKRESNFYPDLPLISPAMLNQVPDIEVLSRNSPSNDRCMELLFSIICCVAVSKVDRNPSCSSTNNATKSFKFTLGNGGRLVSNKYSSQDQSTTSAKYPLSSMLKFNSNRRRGCGRASPLYRIYNRVVLGQLLGSSAGCSCKVKFG